MRHLRPSQIVCYVRFAIKQNYSNNTLYQYHWQAFSRDNTIALKRISVASILRKSYILCSVAKLSVFKALFSVGF